MSEVKQVWTEQYRPKTADEYVFIDQAQREQVSSWIKEKAVPNLLLSGPPGSGKTTLAKVLIKELEIHDFDLLFINASRDRGIDMVRDKIKSFSQTMPYGHLKIIVLDEADFMGPDMQAALRGAMEEYSQTVRFILTCNHPNKIIPALHSRCQGFHIDKLDHTEFTSRIATVLISENIEFDLDILDSFVTATYPDLRKCLNSCQMNSVTGKLASPTNSSKSSTDDYKLSAVELIKKGKIREARQLICAQITPQDADDFFRWSYDNLPLWSKTNDGQDEAILIIRKGLVNHQLVADIEINISAMLVELGQIEK